MNLDFYTQNSDNQLENKIKKYSYIKSQKLISLLPFPAFKKTLLVRPLNMIITNRDSREHGRIYPTAKDHGVNNMDD